jgi:hypothetical protein
VIPALPPVLVLVLPVFVVVAPIASTLLMSLVETETDDGVVGEGKE